MYSRSSLRSAIGPSRVCRALVPSQRPTSLRSRRRVAASSRVRSAALLYRYVEEVALHGDAGRQSPPPHHVLDVLRERLVVSWFVRALLRQLEQDPAELGERLADLGLGQRQGLDRFP